MLSVRPSLSQSTIEAHPCSSSGSRTVSLSQSTIIEHPGSSSPSRTVSPSQSGVLTQPVSSSGSRTESSSQSSSCGHGSSSSLRPSPSWSCSLSIFKAVIVCGETSANSEEEEFVSIEICIGTSISPSVRSSSKPITAIDCGIFQFCGVNETIPTCKDVSVTSVTVSSIMTLV